MTRKELKQLIKEEVKIALKEDNQQLTSAIAEIIRSYEDQQDEDGAYWAAVDIVEYLTANKIIK